MTSKFTTPPEAVGATQRLATFTSGMTFATLPAATVDYTKKILVDGIGCMLAGTRGEPGRIAARASARLRTGDTGPSTVLHDGSHASARDAAFVNGVTLYSVGVNDIHRDSSSHPGGCVVPTVLAVGEWRKSSGKDLLVAMAMGYEMMGRLGRAMIPSHWDCGFHPTGTFGAFAATAAASCLLGLDAAQTTSAFGIAGSQASGNKAFQTDGSLTIIFHAGRAAQNGVEAAVLAQEGFPGPRTVLEDPNGFCVAGTEERNLPALVAGLGERFEIDATSFRPCYGCTFTIGASMALAALLARHPQRTAADIAEIVVVCNPAAKIEIDRADPRTQLAARLSMQFNVALVAELRDVFVGDITDEDLFNPRIRALMPKIRLVEDPAMGLWGNGLTVRFNDGTTDSDRVLMPKGDPENPLSWDDMVNKFTRLTAPLGNRAAGERIIELVRGIENTDGAALVAAIDAMVRGARR